MIRSQPARNSSHFSFGQTLRLVPRRLQFFFLAVSILNLLEPAVYHFQVLIAVEYSLSLRRETGTAIAPFRLLVFRNFEDRCY